MTWLPRALTVSFPWTGFSGAKSRRQEASACAKPQMPFVALLCVSAAVSSFPMSARAGWPERPIKLIVTFPPGSANDAAARIFADALGKKSGKPVVVEDKPGAEGTIGVGAFVAAQDDHTLLYTVAGSVTVARCRSTNCLTMSSGTCSRSPPRRRSYWRSP
jgi:hypothetical protein